MNSTGTLDLVEQHKIDLLLAKTLEALEKKAAELRAGTWVHWRHPDEPLEDPLKGRIRKGWKTWTKHDTVTLRKNEKNWFYAEIEWPEEICGLPLAGSEAHLFMTGWVPFTLWIDGKQWAREEYAWLCTGPILDPIALSIEPGRRVRLTICIEPTELPTNFNLLTAAVTYRTASELSILLEAAMIQLRIAQALARDEGERRLVEQAAAELDLRAITHNRWKQVRASIEQMEKILSPLSPRAKALTVNLIGHSHIDMDWMWTWDDTVNCIRRDLKALSDMQDDYPDLTFTHSQPPTYEVMRQSAPEVFEKIKRRIAEGRWEVATGTWVEGDLNMADGEAVARHMQIAADWSQEHLGARSRILWEPDTFGHPGNMPQLAKLGGLESYYHFRCNPGRRTTWPMRIWQGIDGTALPVFSWFYGSDMAPRHTTEVAMWSYGRGLSQAFQVWGAGDHGGGLSRWQIHLLSLYRDKPLMPTFRFGTVAQMQEAMKGEEDRLPRHVGESFTILEGCYTTHARMKQYNRSCEGALLAAETLSLMAGLDRRTELREAWKPVLFNQFHDIFCGASVADAYQNAYARAEGSLKVAQQVGQEALKQWVALDAKGKTLTVVNPLAFELTAPVRATLPAGTVALQDAEGNLTPVQALGRQSVFIARGVPACSCKHYRILDRLPGGTKFEKVAVEAVALNLNHELTQFGGRPEEAWYHVETRQAEAWINRASGAIGSYVDKGLGREMVGYGVPKFMTHQQTMRQDLALNVFQVLDESPHDMTAWMIHDIVRVENLLRGAEVKLMETGPVFARLHVQHRFRASVIEEDIIFYQDFARVDFEAEIDWHEKGSPETGVPQLKVAFGTGMSAARLHCEGPFSVAEWPADGLERPTQKWADLTGDEFGFAILNDGKYGCDALGGRLRMTLLRNSYAPDANSDEGLHTVRFAFAPHAARFEAAGPMRAGMAFNRPAYTVRTRETVQDAAAGLRLEGADSVVCTTLRRAEHSDATLVRLFESSGREVAVKVVLGKGIKTIREVNFLEEPVPMTTRLEQGEAIVTMRGFEVKTLLLERQ